MIRLRQQLFSIFTILGLVFSGCASTPLKKPELNNRKAYVDAHMNLDPSIREAILRAKVIEGMRYDDVRAAWGEPDVISTSEDSNLLADDEVAWQYNRLFVVPIFIHFTKGVVVYINDDYK